MKVTFLPSGVVTDVAEGTTILEAAIAAGLEIDAPCGGRGVCGKCKVTVKDGAGEQVLLACQTPVHGDITVDITRQDEGHRILMGGISREVGLNPAIRTVSLAVAEPSVKDLRACWERLENAACEQTGLDPAQMHAEPLVATHLYNTLEKNGYHVEAVLYENEILDVREEGRALLALAFDIGTTTIAAYLVDLRQGEQLAQASLLNPQVKYGADVIMRTKYSIENGLEGLTGDVRAALADLAGQCLRQCGQAAEDVYLVTVVGNTCMHHLFLGISPASLAYAPYTATVAEPVTVNAREYGFAALNPCAKVLMLPNIAGFVGADTVGAALAAAVDEAEELTLLIDIGTNGEMVMGNRERLVACSTAAGPAFEGAVITFGMRGAEGAVDHVSFKDDGTLHCSVIGGGKPIGICGSGLIDLLSEFVRIGLVESGGKLIPPEEIENPIGRLFADRIEMIDGLRSFVFATAAESKTGEKLYFTQKDIREIQLAKGAMAAGIEMMAAKLGIAIGDIRHVLIAGAFGSYMSPKSACGIALIPPELENCVLAIGNAAGQGAKLAALSQAEYARAARLAQQMGYLELAADPAFQDFFVDHLEFPTEE